MKENEVAIENALKIEIAESFIDGIKQVFEENYIEVPTEKVDVVDELTERTEELEEQLEDATKANIEIKSMRDDLERFKMFSQACDGLTMSQKDKLSQLSEGVEYESNEDYMSKIELLKEHYFSTKSAVTDAEDLNSDPVEVDQEAPVKSGPMAAYSQAISRTIRK
jgi:predicted nuclease with TOPRIM domain